MVVPTGKLLPEGTPVRVTVTDVEQPSLAVALPSVASLITTPHEGAPGPVLTVTFGGAVIIGSVVSTILMLTVSSLKSPLGSVTLSVIVCGPKESDVLSTAVVPKTVAPSRHSEGGGAPPG